MRCRRHLAGRLDKAKAAMAPANATRNAVRASSWFGRQISAVLERNPMRIEPHGIELHAGL